MASRYKTLIKDILIFGLGSFGSKIILFLLVPLYTNYMTDAEYGTADLVFTVAQLLIPFLSVVIFDAVIRFGLSKQERREDVLLVGVLVLGFAAAAGLLLTPLTGLYHAVADWKWYLYAYIVINIAGSIGFNYLKAKGRNKVYALLNVAQTAMMAGLNVWLLVYRSMGVRGYLLSSVLAGAVTDLVLIFAADVPRDLRRSRFDRDLFRRMLLFSAPLILNNVSWWVIHSSDKVMVELMISAAALGLYTAAAKIPALINVMVSIFQQAWGISAVREIESTNDGAYYADVFCFLFLFTSGACVALVSVMKLFMRHYVGEGFQDAWRYVPLLLVSAVYAAVASYYGSMYSALKKSVNNMLTTLLAAVANILVNFLLIPYIGIFGAVIGTLVSYILLALARMLDVRRYISIRARRGAFALNSLILIAHAALVSLDFHILPVSLVSIALFALINRKDLSGLLGRRRGAS